MSKGQAVQEGIEFGRQFGSKSPADMWLRPEGRSNLVEVTCVFPVLGGLLFSQTYVCVCVGSVPCRVGGGGDSDSPQCWGHNLCCGR